MAIDGLAPASPRPANDHATDVTPKRDYGADEI